MTSLLSTLLNRGCFIVGAILFLISSETSLPLFAEQSPSLAASNDFIVATVNNNPIEKSKLNQVVQEYKVKSGKDVVTLEERKRLVNNIIIRQLILQQPSVQAIKNNKAFIKRIEAYQDAMLIKLFLEKEIGNKLIATDEEMQKYYQLNQDKFKTSKRVSARVILLRNQEEARAVMAKLKDGQDFSTLVNKYSVDLPSASSGGKLEIEEGKFFPQIENAVFNLKENEISEIIETSYGCNIFKVEKIIPAGIKPYEATKDDIKKQLLKQKEARAFFEMAAGLEKEADIKIFEKLLLE